MGLGDYIEEHISSGITRGVDDSLPKLKQVLDEGLEKTRGHVEQLTAKLEERSNRFLDQTQDRLRAVSDVFFSDLEKRWEKRLEAETKAQFKLLNRVLLYTLIVGIFSLAYAVARTKLGW